MFSINYFRFIHKQNNVTLMCRIPHTQDVLFFESRNYFAGECHTQSEGDLCRSTRISNVFFLWIWAPKAGILGMDQYLNVSKAIKCKYISIINIRVGNTHLYIE